MTVTRASVRLETGEVGHAWVQDATRYMRCGRGGGCADADRGGGGLGRPGPWPPSGRPEMPAATRAAKAAATKVDFFTMVRGEDK